jgi:hypothetical protein
MRFKCSLQLNESVPPLGGSVSFLTHPEHRRAHLCDVYDEPRLPFLQQAFGPSNLDQ